MNYKEKFILALKMTNELGLEIKHNPLPFTKALSAKKRQKVLQASADALIMSGYKSSSDLATKCAPVHLMLQHCLKYKLNIDSYLTVGDRYWDDYIYCEMSYPSIKEELNCPKVDNPIKAHVWLTISDGSILDCTAEAHADLLFKRGEHPVEKCLMFVKSDEKANAKSGYHRPYLVGIDFLEKTGVLRSFD